MSEEYTSGTYTKTAIQLEQGDKIIGEGTFPRSLYAGVVEATVVVDGGVQVVLADGGIYVRPEDHRFVLKAEDEVYVVCRVCGKRWTIPYQKGRTTPPTPTSCLNEECDAGWLDISAAWEKADADAVAASLEGAA